jgi:hypothetical protein
VDLHWAGQDASAVLLLDSLGSSVLKEKKIHIIYSELHEQQQKPHLFAVSFYL